MSANFDLGIKHNENKQNVAKFFEENTFNNSTELVKKLNEQKIGWLPAENAFYDDYLGLTVTVEEVAKNNPEAASILVDQVVAREILAKYSTTEFDSTKIYAVLCAEPGIAQISDIKTSINNSKLQGQKQISKEQLNADNFIVIAKDGENTALYEIQKSDINITENQRNFAGTNIALNAAEINANVSQNIGIIKDNFEFIMTVSRTLIAATALGLANGTLVSGIQAVKNTKDANNQAISGTQSIQFTLADLFAELEASRVLTYLSANCIDEKIPNIKYATMAKIQASDSAVKISAEALQLLGNMGYLADNNFADIFANAVNTQVKGGTNRVQRNQVYQYLLK
ncbi:MAG: acyl-CoA dehydrogenase family protein [Candidatus Gastranaerophilales bacterium]|nr:acyl-CoA dehydrogenase family protein [Candidatus Gastranaerophilales bacterium]